MMGHGIQLHESAAAAFLDVDGTLVDSNDFHVAAWQRAFAEVGITIDKQRIHSQIGKGADMLIPFLAPQLSDEQRESIGHRHGELFQADYLHRVHGFSGAQAFIEQLHSLRIKVVLASSSALEEIEHYIELLQVKKYIDAVTSKSDVKHTKPAPDIFRAALLKVAPLSASRVVVVGDTPYDAIAAAACGIRTVALRTGGFNEAELTQAGAVAVYDSIDDLRQKLDTSPFFEAYRETDD